MQTALLIAVGGKDNPAVDPIIHGLKGVVHHESSDSESSIDSVHSQEEEDFIEEDAGVEESDHAGESNVVEPYQFEPQYSSSGRDTDGSEHGDDDPGFGGDPVRQQNTDWYTFDFNS
ncbi:hypothetical protein NQZ68_021788 [Dissostichus eleginoides]|nr:hypothetical protein NQZ68_021788 [Dissostichus eleginoides]